MTTSTMIDGREVELEPVNVEPVRVRILPDGRMDRENAARYLGRRPKTLSMWTLEGKGPPAHKAGGRVFYLKRELDQFLGIVAAA